MPWKQTHPMDQRAQFVTLHQEGLYSMTELCQRFAVSRKTGYKWLNRYQQEGLSGLQDQSRAPHVCQQQMPPDVQQALLDARRAHPTWGPRKLLPYLKQRQPDLELPAASSVGDLLEKHGLIQNRRRRPRHQHPGSSPLSADAPNVLWSTDFKGQFKTGDGEYCFPLTVTDNYSRFLLCCHGLPSVQQEGVFPVFRHLFQEFGLPDAIRTDNGNPFATQAIYGLSSLNVWWIKLGIAHQRIRPGQPQENGRHERMHRTLKAETTRPPQKDHATQQIRFDAFRHEFNEERPHEALGQRTPSSIYVASCRPLPAVLPAPVYAGHLQVRRVSQAGTFRFHHRQPFLSHALAQEEIALEEVADGLWSIYFYNVLLARLDERDYKISG